MHTRGAKFIRKSWWRRHQSWGCVFDGQLPTHLPVSQCPYYTVQDLEIYCLITRPVRLSEIGSRHISKGSSRLSVKCTPPSWVSISSSPSPLYCSMCVHQFVQDLEVYCLISRSVPIIIRSRRRTWVGCSQLSVECTPPNLVSISSSPSPLSAKVWSKCVHRSVQNLIIYSIISRLVPISCRRGIFWRDVVGCPSNAHLQLWYLSAPLNHICLLKFVPSVSIDPFKI